MRRLRFLVEPEEIDRAAAGASLAELSGADGPVVVLPAEEARHLRVSLRGRAGEEVHVFDGRGRGFRARVALVTPARVEVVLLAEDASPVEPPLTLVLLQALSRDEAFERVIDQATALGVTRIVPVLFERGRAVPRAAAGRRLERWRRIARETAKLSWRRIVPAIDEPSDLGSLAPLEPPGAVGLLLDPDAPAGALNDVFAGPRHAEVRIAVGPEGGFGDDERARLVGAGFRPVALGPRILRTEHAGPVALALVLSRWGDIG